MRWTRQWVCLCAALCLAASGAGGQTCDPLDVLVTTTQAPPTSSVTWGYYVKQFSAVEDAKADAVVIGDSLAQGWTADYWLPRKVVNLGVGSDKTQNVLWRLSSPRWSAVKTDQVVVVLGTNNLGGNSVCAIVEGLNAVFHRIQELWPNATITYIAIPPRGDALSAKDDDRRLINTSFAPSNRFRVITIDQTVNPAGDFSLYRPGKLHFLPETYKTLTEMVAPIIFQGPATN